MNAKILQFQARQRPPAPPLWVQLAVLVVGPLLAFAIVCTWLLVALLQLLSDFWEEIES